MQRPLRSVHRVARVAVLVSCAAGVAVAAEAPAWAGVVLSESAASPIDRFAGVYSNETLRLELEPDGKGGLKGTIEVAGTSLPVTAAAEGDGLRGEFTSEGHAFAFTARFDGEALLLESDGAEHRLVREKGKPVNPLAKPQAAPKNPLAGSPGEEQPVPAPAPEVDPAFRQSLPHPVGVTLRCPESWRAQTGMGGLVLIPDDAPRDMMGNPAELYLLLYGAAPGASSIKDPGLAERLGSQVTELMPNLRRDGRPEFFDLADRPAATLRFKGRTDDGRAVRAAAYVTLHDGIAVGLFGVGEEAAMQRRGDLPERIFRAARFAPPERNPGLVGAWTYTESYSDPGSGFSMATQHTVELRADGRYTQRSKVAGGTGAVTGSSGGEGSGGRWYADRETIILVGDEGDVTQVGYTLSGGRLMTTDPSGTRQVWNR